MQCYFAHRADELYFPPSGAATPAPPTVVPTDPTCAPLAPSVSPGAAPGTPVTEDHVPQAPAASSGGDQRAPDDAPETTNAESCNTRTPQGKHSRSRASREQHPYLYLEWLALPDDPSSLHY